MSQPEPKQGNLMEETSLPSSKAGPDEFKNMSISLFPNAPTGQYHHLHKARASKILFSIMNNLVGRSRDPRDLKVIPNSGAKGAVEEKVSPIFIDTPRTKNTTMIFGNMPVPSTKHIFSIQSIM